jgi:hypothetical protein
MAGAGSQTPSSIRCGPIAAQANRKRAARWTTFKARLRLRASTSHRNYRARCAGDLGCTGTLRWRASSSLRHSGPKLPLAQARVPVAKHQRCYGPRVHGHVPDATADALVPARRVVGFQEVAPRAHLGTAAFAGELKYTPAAYGPYLILSPAHLICCESAPKHDPSVPSESKAYRADRLRDPTPIHSRFSGCVRHWSFGPKNVSCFQPIWRSASGASQATPALLSQ